MQRWQILNPGRDVECSFCGEERPGILIRKVGDRKQLGTLCGRCLALALSEVTKQNFTSQFDMWQSVKQIGIQVRKEFKTR